MTKAQGLVCKDEELPELIGLRMGKAQTLDGLALTKKPEKTAESG